MSETVPGFDEAVAHRLAAEARQHRLHNAAARGLEHFWRAVRELYPEVETGDFPPELHFAFMHVAEAAIESWLLINHPDPQNR